MYGTVGNNCLIIVHGHGLAEPLKPKIRFFPSSLASAYGKLKNLTVGSGTYVEIPTMAKRLTF